MSITLSLLEIETLLAARLETAKKEFSGKLIQRLDIGVFPWHGAIELSLLLADDTCDVEDIAGWPNYNFSDAQNGKWPEALNIYRRMQTLWEAGTKSTESFALFGEAVKSRHVQSVVNEFNRSEGFLVTLFDPDRKNSENYCA